MLLALGLLLLAPVGSNVQLSLFPWEGDLESRAEELLSELRRQPHLDIDAKVSYSSIRDLSDTA